MQHYLEVLLSHTEPRSHRTGAMMACECTENAHSFALPNLDGHSLGNPIKAMPSSCSPRLSVRIR